MSGTICHGLLKNSICSQPGNEPRSPEYEVNTLPHRYKAVQVYDIPNLYPVTLLLKMFQYY